MTDIIGEKVSHKRFGEGMVVKQTLSALEVAFCEEVKRFLFPDAFKVFLVAIDPSIDAQLKREAAMAEAQREAQEKMKAKQITEKAKKTLDTAVSRERIFKPTKELVAGDEVRRSNGRGYFFVFQNKSYDVERRGGFLWAPKTNEIGRYVSHWRLMKEVKRGDVIIHSVNKHIVALSVACSDCYSAEQPNNLTDERLWDSDGWRVDCDYIIINKPINTSEHMESILDLQPSKYAPFNKIGRGNTGYLFVADYALADFLYHKLVLNNKYLEQHSKRLGMK